MQQNVISVERSFGIARDFDVRPDGSWVALFERSGGLHVETSLSIGFPLPYPVRYPIVRAIGYDRILVVDSRPMRGTAGGLVLSLEGETLYTMAVGDGIQDVIILDDLIAVTYFDEGVFSGVPPSNEGITFYEFSGKFFGGYRTMFSFEAVDIVDCYAASRLGGKGLAFSAYTGFQLVRVYPRACRQEVIEVPSDLHGASALSVSGDVACFFAPYKLKRALLTWKPGARIEEVGHHSGPLRGLDGRYFLSNGQHGYTLVEWAG